MKNAKILILMATLLCFKIKAQVTVGWEDTCDYDISEDPVALQQAIDDGNMDIRLTNANEYLHSISIRDQVQIKGGYVNCHEAVNGNQTNINSTINAELDDFYSGVFIFDIEDADILLDSITVKNGTDSGIYISKIDGGVTLKNLNIRSNSGSTGGGVYINNNHCLPSSDLLTVEVQNSIIQQNESFSGGGIECSFSNGNVPIKLIINQGSVIHENHADNNGGGLNLLGCDLKFDSGVNTINNGNLELFNNTATLSGGALSAQDSEIELVGSFNHSFDIEDNEAGFGSQGNASGGGLNLVGSSNVSLINTNITGNKSDKHGAGLFTTTGSTVTMDIDVNGCDYNDYCSSITANQLLRNVGGGAALAATGGSIEVYRTLINLNNANGFGYISYIDNDAESILEGNLILANGLDQAFTNENGMYQADTSSLSLYYNTTNQNSNSVPFIRADDTTELIIIGNIIDESSDILHSSNNVIANINCNMLAQIDNITAPMTDTIVDRADFVDNSTFGDFQLMPSSTNAMDICSSVPYEPSHDLANNPRGVDNPDVPDTNGLYDLGAYEFIPVTDRIFKNGFEY